MAGCHRGSERPNDTFGGQKEGEVSSRIESEAILLAEATNKNKRFAARDAAQGGYPSVPHDPDFLPLPAR